MVFRKKGLLGLPEHKNKVKTAKNRNFLGSPFIF